tara:strand:+ start:45082 stop:45573 length:492 start_codon:yes stop_codon:yes gene_type:complete
MQQKIVIVLGSPNYPSGALGEISKSRLNYCLNTFQEGNLILCTGGWGAHFNTAEKAHASYSKTFLIEHGISENSFLEFALSTNTVEDAVKTKQIVSKFENPQLTIVTSDYHLNRVKLIFNEILEKYAMNFIGIESNLNKEEYSTLVLHEQKAIQSILEIGLYY